MGLFVALGGRLGILLLFCGCSWSVLYTKARCDEPRKAPLTSSDPKIQELINAVVYAPDDDAKEVREAVKKLWIMARKSPKLLAPQLIHYGARAKNETESVGMLMMVKRLGPPFQLLEPMLPFLESEDERIQEEAIIWLRAIDLASSTGGDCTDPAQSRLMSYRQALLQRKGAPPPALVTYLYATSPSHAMLILAQIDSEHVKRDQFPRDLMWSDHLITTVKWRIRKRFLKPGDIESAHQEMEALSKHPGWYARRYVVEVLREYPELGTPQIRDRLKKDENPLVRAPVKLKALRDTYKDETN